MFFFTCAVNLNDVTTANSRYPHHIVTLLMILCCNKHIKAVFHVHLG